MSEFLSHLLKRRSVQAAFLEAPGPDENQIETILTAAARVPDHKKLEPFRFIRFDEAACKAFGMLLADHVAKLQDEVGEGRMAMERERLLRAPFVVAVVSSPNHAAPVPQWEQIMTAGAVCMNMLHAAHAMGFAAQWLTEWYAFDRDILNELGLSEAERIAGFVHIGTPDITPDERPRPKLEDKVTYWRR